MAFARHLQPDRAEPVEHEAQLQPPAVLRLTIEPERRQKRRVAPGTGHAFSPRVGSTGREHRDRGLVSGQNDTDIFIEMVRGAPSLAAFSTIPARLGASKRLFATSDTSADLKRSVRPSTENVR